MRWAVLVFVHPVLAPCVVQAQALPEDPVEYRFEVLPITMRSGSVSLSSASRLVLRGVDAATTDTLLTRRDAAGTLARIAGFVILDFPLLDTSTLLTHEVFGHGARIREFGFRDEYRLHVPGVYRGLFGGGGSEARYVEGAVPATFDEDALITVGGSEAEEIATFETGFASFRSGRIGRGDALAYVAGPVGSFTYALLDMFAVDGGDSEQISEHYAARYGASATDEHRALAVSWAVRLLDPVFLTAMKAYFVSYLFEGRRSVGFPAIELGNVRVGMSTGLYVVPWGREHQLNLWLGTSVANISISGRFGEGPGGPSFAGAVRLVDVRLIDRVWLRGSAEWFWQPTLFVADRQHPWPERGGLVSTTQLTSGVSAEAGVEIRFGGWFTAVNLDAKSRGFSPGKPYDAALTLSLALGARLRPI